jgi:uncharacterized protein (TIGR04255 family)
MPTNINEHIVEVLFAMWFDPKSNDWDSTYFGKYHDRIQPLGYTEKQEQKQMEFQLDLSTRQPNSQIREGGIRMIFRNPTLKTAIILANHYISFHKLAPYNSWEDLMESVVDKGLQLYQELGIGNVLWEVQCLYLNRWELKADESISKYFNFLPNINEGKESNVLFQAKYEIPDNISAQLKLNSTPKPDGSRDLSFECSTFAKAISSTDYRILGKNAHDKANNVFQKIINS